MTLWKAGYGVEPWRTDPMTNDQQQLLAEFGDVRDENLTKGEASDLIANFQMPSRYEREILEFFSVPGIIEMTQLEARVKLRELAKDERNFEEWSERPASGPQLRLLREVGESDVEGLTFARATEILTCWEEDEIGQLRLTQAREKIECEDETLSLIDDLLERITRNDWLYEFDGLRREHVDAAVESLMRQGMALNEILDDDDLVTRRILARHPELRLNRMARSGYGNPNDRSTEYEEDLGSKEIFGVLVWIIVLLVVFTLRYILAG